MHLFFDFDFVSYAVVIAFVIGAVLGLATGIGWHWVAYFFQNLRGR